MEKKTRVPAQKRSQEKYEKIITAALELFNEVGYYNITTADIARKADVATGSVYSYFKDKKEIYIEVLRRVHNNFYKPTRDFWIENGKTDLKDSDSVKKLFHVFIKIMIDTHNFSKLFHDDMTALELLDPEIAAVKKENYENRLANTKEVFEIVGIPFKSKETSEVFLHYCNLLIDDVCHQILYDKTVSNIDIYIEQAVDMLYKLLLNLSDVY